MRLALRDAVALARPRDWLKSAFVLMPVPFALASGAVLDLAALFWTVVAFCLASSSVYVFNDVYDAERDRMHPLKGQRPVAAGRVAKGTALAYSAVLAALAIAVTIALDLPGVVLVLLGYLSVNLVYCLRAKHIPLLDVFLLSSGFVLRILAGVAVMQVPPSRWLLLCGSALALFLALAKRRSDLIARNVDHRPALMGYSIEFLNQALSISATITLISYSLYCIEAGVLRAGREFATVPFVVFAVLEYLRLVHVNSGGSSPIDLILSSRPVMLSTLGWIVAAVWSIGLL